MNFLVDHQLPPLLAVFLRSCGHEAKHVRELGLSSKDDLAIWQHAKVCDFILISKDEDFFHLINRAGENGKLIWVRLGNCRNQPLLEAFQKALPQILNSFAENYRLVELR